MAGVGRQANGELRPTGDVARVRRVRAALAAAEIGNPWPGYEPLGSTLFGGSRELMISNDFPYGEANILAVEIGDESELRSILAALLEAEINTHYVYSFIKRPMERCALAISAEDPETAAQALGKRGFKVLQQGDISR